MSFADSSDSTVTGTQRRGDAAKSVDSVPLRTVRLVGLRSRPTVRGIESAKTNRQGSVAACFRAFDPTHDASGASRTAYFSASPRLCVYVAVESVESVCAVGIEHVT